MKARAATRGFTLVEMLVALLIFAVLAGAGVGLLRASVDTQQAVNGALADLGTAARLRSLLGADLGQAVVRPVADAPTGFLGEAGNLVMVRAAEPAERVAGQAGLQALRWTLEGDRLVRAQVTADGRPSGPSATLAREVAGLALRYRARTGEWRSSWPTAASDPVLPVAVELTLQRRNEAPVRLVVALPEGPAPALGAPA